MHNEFKSVLKYFESNKLHLHIHTQKHTYQSRKFHSKIYIDGCKIEINKYFYAVPIYVLYNKCPCL